ncbi:arginine-hydroxylase NDUFAF5, mitochondrial-like [Centruroides vittatus]|uniref:arginine-hydroxylase NDUFAF5, mitochondrial-like n=1 Tax=Centruroides vittatus TaxID=120091 RepID=UPI00350FEACA
MWPLPLNRICTYKFKNNFIQKSKILYKYLSWNSLLLWNKLMSTSDSEIIMNVFDREAKRLQRNRAAMAKDVEVYDYLKEEIGYRISDRVFDIKRKFDVAVDLGCGRGFIGPHLNKDVINCLIQFDLSDKYVEQSKICEEVKTFKLIADEEMLPFGNNTIDIFLSSLSLHWVNDLPGTFHQINFALKKDGVFVASMFGGDTLFELRCSLQQAETEIEGGFAPHISPFTDVRDLGNLLNRAGFTMLTIDTDEVIVNYPSMIELMNDLKGMAENNCLWARKVHLHRATIERAKQIYNEMYGNEDGTVPAMFQILYMIGWKPHESQAKPARRGSGTFSFKDLHKLETIIKKSGDIDFPSKES